MEKIIINLLEDLGIEYSFDGGNTFLFFDNNVYYDLVVMDNRELLVNGEYMSYKKFLDLL